MAWIIVLLVVASAACLGWGFLPQQRSSRLVRERLLSEMSEEKRPTPLSQLVDMLAPINRFLPTTLYSAYIKGKIEGAGLRFLPMQFFVLQEIGAVVGVMLYFFTLGTNGVNVAWLALFVLMGFLVPYLWLNNRVQTRRRTISRDLPEIVDLLSLCVDAGMDFMNALTRVVKEYRPCPTTEELGMAIQEVRVGKRRREALRGFSARVQTPEASSFSRTLVQADRMGTGIAEALRILSEDMRVQRYNWAERFAQQAPVKMLLPLLLSLMAALTIVAGPILAQFLRGGFSVGNYQQNAAGGGAAE